MLIKHSGLEYSSNKVLATAFVSGDFYITGSVSYIGKPDRIYIVGVSKKTGKNLFIRDVKSEQFKFENKISLAIEEDMHIYLNVKSESPVWVDFIALNHMCDGETLSLFNKADIDERKVKESKKSDNDTKENLADEFESMPKLANRANKKEICSIDLKSISVYRNELLVKIVSHGKILIEGVDESDKVIFRRKVTSNKEFKTIIRTSSSKKMTMFVDKSVELIVLKNKSIFLDDIIDYSSIVLTEKSVTAAMATYPAREHIICDAIDSIISQVDKLYIYLNNYEKVPSCILNHEFFNKIDYILDPKSNLRASAKFMWLDSVKGYHLTLDDDIIYPENYVAKLIECSKNHDDEALIGVHGSIFNEKVSDASKCRKEIFNFQESLDAEHKTHMIGSGTALFSNKIASKINAQRLFDHPLANDELLAIIMKELSIDSYAVPRGKLWLMGHPDMEFGIFEEKQLNKGIKAEVSKLVSQNNPWPQIQ
jgi:hypothetical protein